MKLSFKSFFLLIASYLVMTSLVLASPHHHQKPNGVISLDVVSQDGKLHLLTGQHQAGKQSLWYQNSTDAGQNWSQPVSVALGNKRPQLSRGNDARVTVQGDIITVVWMQYAEKNRFRAGPLATSRSIDGGKTWQPGQLPSAWQQGGQGYFTLASDEKMIHLAWLDSQTRSNVKGTQGLRYTRSKDSGLTWAPDQTLDNMTCACCWNTGVIDSAGDFLILYRDKQPSDMAIGRVNGLQQWSRLATVGGFNWIFDGCPHIGGDLNVSHQDNVIHAVVGTGHPSHAGIYYLASTDGGKQWRQPLKIGSKNALHAAVIKVPDGRIVVAWDAMTAAGMTIFSSESRDGGHHWTTNKQISESGIRASHPRLVKVKQHVLVFWTEHRGRIQQLASQLL